MLKRLAWGWLLPALFLAALLPAGCGLSAELRLPSGVVYPSITPDVSAQGTRSASHTFRFEGRDRAITVEVEESLYAGAKAATKSVIRFGGAREDDWIEEYYPAFIWEEHQAPFFEALLVQLRSIRASEGLDADRYAELLTVFAQSLEYHSDPIDLEPKFPVETFVELAGDCDDKTLLLAGLLAREGYDVAIMLFEPEQHVSLGLRVGGAGYRGTGYAFVETTAPAFIGMVPESFAGGTVLTSVPHVFPVDGGSGTFGASPEVESILAAYEQARNRIVAVGEEVARADAALAALEARVSAEAARLDTLRASGRTDEYNAAVPSYNALAAEFNELAAERNRIADEYNLWVDLQNHIADNLDDRAGTYRHVTGVLPAISR